MLVFWKWRKNLSRYHDHSQLFEIRIVRTAKLEVSAMQYQQPHRTERTGQVDSVWLQAGYWGDHHRNIQSKLCTNEAYVQRACFVGSGTFRTKQLGSWVSEPFQRIQQHSWNCSYPVQEWRCISETLVSCEPSRCVRNLAVCSAVPKDRTKTGKHGPPLEIYFKLM